MKKRGRPRLPEGRAVRNVLLRSYKNHAAERGLVWNISDEQFDTLLKGDCHYCGDPPKAHYTIRNCYGAMTYNGIDRVDSSQGYHSGNVVSCCKTCNKCKSNMGYEEFISFLIKAGKFQSEKRSTTVPLY